LYKNFIFKEGGNTVTTAQTTLKSGYESYVYYYNGTGASSGRIISERTYVFTRDNKTAFYIMFATPRNSTEENNEIIQKIMDSVIIN
jgi:hypothetical protein